MAARPNPVPLRSAAWIALFAILLAALAPPVSKLVRTLQGDPPAFAELCSTTRADGGASTTGKAPGAPAAAMEHCPFCSTHADGPWLPPASPGVAIAADAAHAVAFLFLHAPRPLHAWGPAQPRGPPSLS